MPFHSSPTSALRCEHTKSESDNFRFYNDILNTAYSHAPHNDFTVNDGPHIRRWFFFFFSSTTPCEFWLAQLFLSIVSSLAPSFSNFSLPSSSSFLTSSSHLSLGLPFGLVAYGFHLHMLLATLSSGILSTVFL
jgi:hypothetical protein